MDVVLLTGLPFAAEGSIPGGMPRPVKRFFKHNFRIIVA